MKAQFDKTSRNGSNRCLTPRLSGILTLTALLEASAMQSQAQQNRAMSEMTGSPNVPVRPISESYNDTGSISAVFLWTHPSEAGTPLRLKLESKRKDGQSLSSIIKNVGTKRAESTLASARVLTADLMSSMNRNTSSQGSPVELTDRHVASVFRNTARDSLGAYIKENYHPAGLVEIVRETLLDNAFDRRIISPFSPADAGNPGTAYARKGDVHIGLRDIWSTNPRGFITFSDKAEFDVTRKNPSITVRDPLYIDHRDKRKAFITAVGVNYPDWQVDKWSVPGVGATLSYVCDNESVSLTASAGRCNFESGHGGVESRYGEQVMLYAQRTF